MAHPKASASSLPGHLSCSHWVRCRGDNIFFNNKRIDIDIQINETNKIRTVLLLPTLCMEPPRQCQHQPSDQTNLQSGRSGRKSKNTKTLNSNRFRGRIYSSLMDLSRIVSLDVGSAFQGAGTFLAPSSRTAPGFHYSLALQNTCATIVEHEHYCILDCKKSLSNPSRTNADFLDIIGKPKRHWEMLTVLPAAHHECRRDAVQRHHGTGLPVLAESTI